MGFSEQIGHAYYFAKLYIIKKGFADEIDWQNDLIFENLTEQKFLEEIAWVILSSGMNEQIIRKLFPKVSKIMFDFQSAEKIKNSKGECYFNAIQVFNHPGKINAILYAAEYVTNNSFEAVKLKINQNNISFLMSFPYLGNATAYHMAKNIGLNVAKPDRHLIRISKSFGFQSPTDLCNEISAAIGEKISTIDLVLWRYATIDKHYVSKIERYYKKIIAQ